MTDEIRLDPQRAMRAGSRLANVAEQMLRLRNTSGGRIELANQTTPWGKDKLGDSFEKMSEDGAQRYPGLSSLILDIWKAASERSAQMGADIVTSAQHTVTTDEQAAQGMDAIRTRHPGQ